MLTLLIRLHMNKLNESRGRPKKITNFWSPNKGLREKEEEEGEEEEEREKSSQGMDT